MIVIKRDGSSEEFDRAKIKNAIIGAFQSVSALDEEKIKSVATDLSESISVRDGFTVEEIQNRVELALMQNGYYAEAKSYILYRQQHAEARFIKERIDYMNEYSKTTDNAATASETDANANVTMKNVANLEGEVYKTTNRVIQRQRMKDKLNQMYPEVAKQYEQDLNHHIIYTHDEASTPVLKQYCVEKNQEVPIKDGDEDAYYVLFGFEDNQMNIVYGVSTGAVYGLIRWLAGL